VLKVEKNPRYPVPKRRGLRTVTRGTRELYRAGAHRDGSSSPVSLHLHILRYAPLLSDITPCPAPLTVDYRTLRRYLWYRVTPIRVQPEPVRALWPLLQRTGARRSTRHHDSGILETTRPVTEDWKLSIAAVQRGKGIGGPHSEACAGQLGSRNIRRSGFGRKGESHPKMCLCLYNDAPM
jgi:hypothetical protein